MNSLTKKIVFASVTFASLASAGALKETLQSFEDPDRVGYVQPIATLMGTLQNSGWLTSARVAESTSWTISLGIPVAYIGADDHTYTMGYDNGCTTLQGLGKSCPSTLIPQADGTLEGAPTMWGGVSNDTYYRYTNGVGADVSPIKYGTAASGVEQLRSWTTLPFIFPQFAYSHSHFRGAIRFLGAPASGVFGGARFIGLGLQYDFSGYLPPVVNEKGIYTSVAFDINSWSVGFKPTGDITGELTLDGLAYMPSLVAGYRTGKFEVFTELGYEQSNMKTGGDLTDASVPVGDPDREIKPRLNVDGRNGFRMSFNVAMHLGAWQPVIGQSVGAQMGTSANLIQFGKEGE